MSVRRKSFLTFLVVPLIVVLSLVGLGVANAARSDHSVKPKLDTPTITISSFTFHVPAGVRHGTIVKVVNKDAVLHTVTSNTAGKFNVQVCTNISCMLRGAYDVFERFHEELGIGHKGVTSDGLFSLEEVECIGACCWAPAIQVNYAFHDDLTPDSVPEIVAEYRQKAEGQNHA